MTAPPCQSCPLATGDTDTLATLRAQAVVAQCGRTRRVIPAGEIRLLQASAKCVEVHHGEGVALIDEPLCRMLARLDTMLSISRGVAINVRHLRTVRREADARLWVYVDGVERGFVVARRRALTVSRWLEGRWNSSQVARSFL